MTLILSIESSTAVGSVALLRDGEVLGLQQYHIAKSHSSLLHVMMEQITANAGVKMKELSAVAVAEGPGSYTGLRIGVSAAKGLCFALDVPLIAINTLEALAFQVHEYQTSPMGLCPMLDARRMEVYALLMDGDLNVLKPTAPVVLETYAYEDVLAANQVLFFGDGAGKAKPIIQHPNAYFIDHVYPSAQDVARLAMTKYERKQFENVVRFEPLYLKEFRTTQSKRT